MTEQYALIRLDRMEIVYMDTSYITSFCLCDL